MQYLNFNYFEEKSGCTEVCCRLIEGMLIVIIYWCNGNIKPKNLIIGLEKTTTNPLPVHGFRFCCRSRKRNGIM